MGSKKPKWLIKQIRGKAVADRKEARKTKPGTKDLGVKRVGKHGGHKHGHGV